MSFRRIHLLTAEVKIWLYRIYYVKDYTMPILYMSLPVKLLYVIFVSTQLFKIYKRPL